MIKVAVLLVAMLLASIVGTVGRGTFLTKKKTSSLPATSNNDDNNNKTFLLNSKF